MIPKGPLSDEDTSRDPHIEAAFARLVQQAEAPPDFVARVLTKVEQRVTLRPRPLAWLRHGWSPTWATALAMGLLLSIGVNTWFGYELLERRQPFQTPSQPSGNTRQDSPSESRPFIFRGGEPQGTDMPESGVGRAEAVLVEELRRLAVAHYQAKHYAQAITAATAALVLDADAPALYFYRGMAYEAIGDRSQAIRDLQHAARRANAEAQRVLRTWGVEW